MVKASSKRDSHCRVSLKRGQEERSKGRIAVTYQKIIND